MAQTLINNLSYSTLDATKLSGNLPAISGASLTGITTGKVLQIQTAFGGSGTTLNTTTTQNPINGNFYATITPTTSGNKLIILGVCDLDYSNAGTYHDIGFCYSTDGGSNYVTTNMGGKSAKGYYTGVTRLEGTYEFTTGELTTSSINEHRITFNGISGNGAVSVMPNGRSSIIIYEVAQ
jgi:hypothetical protein